MTRRVTRRQPYVGVSGVISPEQQRTITDEFCDPMSDVGRVLAMGVKATHKPQFEDTENKYGPLWYPVGNDITRVLDPHDSRTLNVAQMYFEPEFIESDPTYPAQFIAKLQSRTAHFLDAVQVDLLRYEKHPEKYRHVIRAMGGVGLKRIVQCHGYAMQGSPQKAIDTLKRLIGTQEIDYVLFDASHGRGMAMSPSTLLPFIEKAYNDCDFATAGTNFGVAGGLNGENIRTLLPTLLRDHEQLSWDAEGQLHNSVVDGGDGSLDMERTRVYLRRSLDLLM